MKRGKPVIIHFDFYDLLIACSLVALAVMGTLYFARWR